MPGWNQANAIPFSRFCGAESPGPGPPVGVLLAGGADDRSDVEVGGPSREADVLPRPEPEQVAPPSKAALMNATFCPLSL